MTLVQCDSEDWQGGGAAVGSPRGLGVLLQGHPDTRLSRGPRFRGAWGCAPWGLQPGRSAPQRAERRDRTVRGVVLGARNTVFCFFLCVQHPGVVTTCGEVSPLYRVPPELF